MWSSDGRWRAASKSFVIFCTARSLIEAYYIIEVVKVRPGVHITGWLSVTPHHSCHENNLKDLSYTFQLPSFPLVAFHRTNEQGEYLHDFLHEIPFHSCWQRRKSLLPLVPHSLISKTIYLCLFVSCSKMRFSTIASTFFLAAAVSAQQNITVIVGANGGLTYNPSR
jgi:hypothetical protein